MPVATAFLAILKGFGSFLLLLAGLTAFATVVQNLKSRSNRRKKLHSVKSVEDEEERLKRHEDGKREAREKADVEHMRKANDYVDRKLKPRQEELRQRKLAEADRFSDPAWKDPGHKLGTTKEDTNSGTSPTEPTIKDESELVAEGARRVQDALRAFSDVDDLGLDDEALTFAPAKLVTPAIPSSDEEFEMLEAACLDESSQRPEQADHRVAADRAPTPSTVPIA
ncbi:PREDICTED: uncharacterized protein LOC106811191 [Priapulus caudatus]|uniref:Uncharacterized protein LOC106811191 n=1 Tax=Priapulus caudatus TaxID=37621 RepID=A0ABM1EDF3_PRICU|nr:PREDICTED: uncharacterized protein LOC106811191 [Priapulus caudatus]